jgi:alpha-aminoadipate carrier protein LysW
MNGNCIDCAAPLEVPSDTLDGEIIACPDCGLDYVMEIGEQGSKQLNQLTIEGEDWGE